MDGLIILVIALALCLRSGVKSEELHTEYVNPIVDRETMLNPEFYRDDKAFTRMIDELNF